MLQSRYKPKDNNEHQAQRLLDAHAIGLLINDDFQYDASARSCIYPPRKDRGAFETKNGERVISREALAEILDKSNDDKPKIKNYAIFCPYGLGSKLFLHGKDIFTPEAAEKYYVQHQHDNALFDDAAIERIEKIFLPESFSDRAGNYYFSQGASNLAVLKMSIDAAKEMYPHVDFSALPETNNIMKFASKFMSILEEHGIDLAQLLEQAQANSSHYAALVKKKIADEMPTKVAAYLEAHDSDASETKLKAAFGTQLKDYMAAHEWDWEILENFKAAAHASTDQVASLEEMLQIGAKQRAIAALHALAKDMTNPYDARFVEPEKSMARIVADSVQPMVVKYALRDKTPFLFSSSTDVTAFNDDFQQLPHSAYGKYQPNTPFSPYFSNFLLFANRSLNHDDLAHATRHECEHKVDIDGGITFASRFKEQIPAMVTSDVAKVQEMEDFIRGVDEASPELHDLLVLAKKRGLKEAPKDIAQLKKALLYDIQHIKQRLAIFAPDIDSSVKLLNEDMYAQTFSQWLEIPAIMEEIKGQYGRLFVGEIVPQLSKATDSHRIKTLHAARQQDTASGIS